MLSGNYYQILQVSHTATLNEIKAAYRKKALIYHPDKNHGLDDNFKQILAVYETLSNPRKRAMYDLSLLPKPRAQSSYTRIFRQTTVNTEKHTEVTKQELDELIKLIKTIVWVSKEGCKNIFSSFLIGIFYKNLLDIFLKGITPTAEFMTLTIAQYKYSFKSHYPNDTIDYRLQSGDIIKATITHKLWSQACADYFIDFKEILVSSEPRGYASYLNYFDFRPIEYDWALIAGLLLFRGYESMYRKGKEGLSIWPHATANKIFIFIGLAAIISFAMSAAEALEFSSIAKNHFFGPKYIQRICNEGLAEKQIIQNSEYSFKHFLPPLPTVNSCLYRAGALAIGTLFAPALMLAGYCRGRKARSVEEEAKTYTRV